ncbi:hypothetical protein BQ8482_110026 [Mesorhizobium delmotii]|uniref:Uncharacterized protein n=1 Tax=Mesorhizobium delmotii TaxID=1631247 RepID=A0A2P9AAG0_9HYPH|nr:hypothetical protein BQ8482_110026 [Mesorhizobium delmotii]
MRNDPPGTRYRQPCVSPNRCGRLPPRLPPLPASAPFPRSFHDNPRTHPGLGRTLALRASSAASRFIPSRRPVSSSLLAAKIDAATQLTTLDELSGLDGVGQSNLFTRPSSLEPGRDFIQSPVDPPGAGSSTY